MEEVGNKELRWLILLEKKGERDYWYIPFMSTTILGDSRHVDYTLLQDREGRWHDTGSERSRVK